MFFKRFHWLLSHVDTNKNENEKHNSMHDEHKYSDRKKRLDKWCVHVKGKKRKEKKKIQPSNYPQYISRNTMNNERIHQVF